MLISRLLNTHLHRLLQLTFNLPWRFHKYLSLMTHIYDYVNITMIIISLLLFLFIVSKYRSLTYKDHVLTFPWGDLYLQVCLYMYLNNSTLVNCCTPPPHKTYANQIPEHAYIAILGETFELCEIAWTFFIDWMELFDGFHCVWNRLYIGFNCLLFRIMTINYPLC